MSRKNSHWHVLGAGSIGCLWGAHLALSGSDVTLLLRDAATLDALRHQGGIRLSEGTQDQVVPVRGEPTEVDAGQCANVLVCTKAHQTLDALTDVRARIGAGTCLLILQNGMGVSERVAAEYPQATLFVGSTTEGAWRRERFRVVHAGRGTTWLGAGHSYIDETTQNRVLGDFTGGDLAVSWDHDIGLRLWRKLAVNCAVNPLTALWNCRNGELMRRARSRRLVERVCREVELVLASEGITLDKSVFDMVIEVTNATADNRSSMLQDLSAGRRTEIDWINGYLVDRADARSVPAPMNRFLVDMVRAAESVRDNTGISG